VVGHSILGQRGSATGGVVWGEAAGQRTTGGGCSGVFVFYLHMGMGKIHWREEGDPIINSKKIEIFFHVRDVFFVIFFWHVFLPSVGCRVG
jgi:hypothetical protein